MPPWGGTVQCPKLVPNGGGTDTMNNANDLGAGCSAMSWTTRDDRHLWGRNFDFNRMAGESGVVYLPRGTRYRTCSGPAGADCRALYAAVGTGLLLDNPSPVLYEGINEKGLMGGQLYYRGFARFEEELRQGTTALQPPLVVYHLLAQCASAAEAADMLERQVTLAAVPMLGTVPPLHWCFSDRTGETIVVEPDRDGLHLYRSTIGVMTNSPGYPWHRLNLLNYAGIRDLDYDTLEVAGDRLEQCFSGSGAQGLPGDWSSPSRFIRLAFLKKYGVQGAHEEEGVARMFRLFQSAAFPLGMVRVSQPGHVTELDEGVVDWDYTIYTAVMCAESRRFYWSSYENQRVQYVELSRLAESRSRMRFDCKGCPDFKNVTDSPDWAE